MKFTFIFQLLIAASTSTYSLGFLCGSNLKSNYHKKLNTVNVHESSSDFFVEGPPLETKPNYDEIHGPLGKNLDSLFLKVFRRKMAEQIGSEYDSDLPDDDYKGLMELAGTMNAKYSNVDVQRISQNILKSLFPDFILGNFGWMFAKPFPTFSAKMNAGATFVAGTWLMGETEINDCKVDGDIGDEKSGINQGLLVKRCRFLEESGCASVCVNSCKIPTENFFMEDMKLPLTMEPNYETYECQFSFGLTPAAEDERQATDTPCLSRCPSAGGLRRKHTSLQSQCESSVCPQMR